MKLLQEKLAKYDEPQRAMAAGIYPYFRVIESDQDTEVIINGKKVLMFGSNAYTGLTNHPKVKEAAIEAIKKYGTDVPVRVSLTARSTCISNWKNDWLNLLEKKMPSSILPDSK